MLLDGAHNPGGVDALGSALDEYLSGRRIRMVLGMVADKATRYCVRELVRRAFSVYACAPQNERALPSGELAALAERDCPHVTDCGTAERAIDTALAAAGINDCVLVCGSLYLVGEAEKNLSMRQKAPD
ncbi:hypothetical protein SDC9_209330 [bioreactor metagenome]|uniref:Mur ligase C-terminal domain-containing protein n=1 Tax=bioreactor metagenome TaxID=1076179 RepID=A0A645JEH9_9ZZZZ